MQIKSLRVKSYRSWRINDNASGEAITRLKQLELYATLREEGCSEPTSLAVVGWSRATYYRWLKRYREAGLKGLESGPRAPRRTACLPMDKATGAAGVAPAQTLSVMGQAQALAGISTGAWLDIEREHGGAHRGQAGAAGPGQTGIFLLWPGKTQAPAAVYPPCQTLALRDEGEGTGGVDAGGPHEYQLQRGRRRERVQGHLSGQQMERAAGV